MLFAGAGFSRGATNLRNQPFKTAAEFADALSARVSMPPGTPLTHAADEFAATEGDDALIYELHQEFTAREVAPYHIRIATLPWHRIYTTNYDNVLETAATKIGRKLVAATTRDSVSRLPKRETLCVHLNGYIDRLNRDTIQTELKLTERSYLTEILPESAWAVLFRQDVLVAKAVIFIGYGLGDIDITRLLVDTAATRRKCFFILPAGTPKATIRRAERVGQVVELTTADFARQIENARAAPAVPRTPTTLSCYRRFKINEISAEPSADRRVFDLFMWGRLDDRALVDSSPSSPEYALERSTVPSVVAQIDGGVRAVVIHSHLGNGKTVAFRAVLAKALELNWAVWEITARTPELLRETDTILKEPTKILIAVDDYPAWMDVVRYIGSNASDRVTVLLTARTPAHDVLLDDLHAALHLDVIPEWSVDRLDDVEAEWFVDMLDRHGLWGTSASQPLQLKRRIIVHDCRRQISSVLLRVFESPQIIARFDALLGTLSRKNDYYEVLIAILVLNVLRLSSSTNVLADLCDATVVTDSRFRHNDVVRQLLDSESGEITARSSVAAQYLLQRVGNSATISDVIARLARRADRAAAASAHYRSVLKELMRFSNLKLLLGQEESGPAALRLYESIRNLYGCRDNPHFWLQYAIAALFTGDLARADKYFDTSYAFARQRKATYGDYDTYQIDNHYARHLLVSVVERMDVTNAMPFFRRARKIINEQLKSERLHYPYRVARLYFDFFSTFEQMLRPDDSQELARAAKFVLDQSAKLPPDRQRHKYVRECREGMEYILERVASSSSASDS